MNLDTEPKPNLITLDATIGEAVLNKGVKLKPAPDYYTKADTLKVFLGKDEDWLF